MTVAWVILSKRYGGDVRSPSNEALANAVAEVYVENHAGMSQADYVDHPSAWLRYGHDDGPMYVVTLDRTGTATFEQWADQDYNTELSEPRTLHNVTQRDANQLWLALSDGRIADVRALFGLNARDA